MKTRKIGLANYLAYGAGDFLGAGTTALTAAWLLYFYTTFCGLTPIEATLIFAAARVLDAVVSPLMGELTGLGPITLFSGTRDVLNPDAHLLVDKAAAAGVDLEFPEGDGQVHVYPLLPTAVGRAARATIVQRLGARAAEPAASA